MAYKAVFNGRSLCHFNPYHDPRNGRFARKNGGVFVDTGYDSKVWIKNRFDPNNVNNKRHFDTTLKAGKTKLQTLSFNPNRTKDTDMFYASANALDSAVYKALLNTPIPQDIKDENGNVIGTGMMYRKAIINTVNKDVKVASEDNSARIFSKLYSTDRDFFNFVVDKNRMRKYFDDKRYGHKGYRETRSLLEKMDKNPDYVPDRKEMQVLYRMFNFVIPYDGGADDKVGAKDVVKQRAKFFKALSQEGYGACLDTNDSIYNKLKAANPVIVFDMESVVPKEIKDTSIHDRQLGIAALSFRKTFGI